MPVALCDANVVSPADNGVRGCDISGTPTAIRQVNAYQITGLTFAGFGAGTTFGFTPNFGVSAELKVEFMFPTFGTVISPALGPVFAF